MILTIVFSFLKLLLVEGAAIIMEPQQAGTAQPVRELLQLMELPPGPDTGAPLEIVPPLLTEAPRAETARAGDTGAAVTAVTREAPAGEAVAAAATEVLEIGEVVTGVGMTGEEVAAVATGAPKGAAAGAIVEGIAGAVGVMEATALTVEAVEEATATGITAAAAMATVTAEALGKNTSLFYSYFIHIFMSVKSLSHPGSKY